MKLHGAAPQRGCMETSHSSSAYLPLAALQLCGQHGSHTGLMQENRSSRWILIVTPHLPDAGLESWYPIL